MSLPPSIFTPDAPPVCPAPEQTEVVIRLGWLDDSWTPAGLSGEERERGERLSDPLARAWWLRSRGLARRWLGEALGREPGEVILPPQGALILDPSQNPRGLSVSLSHSGPWFALAIAAGGAVGVDLETWRRVARAEALASRFFATEEAQAVAEVAEPERSRRFLRLWTAKEALVKASGLPLMTLLGQAHWREAGRTSDRLTPAPGVAAPLAGWQVALLGERLPCCLACCLPAQLPLAAITLRAPPSPPR